MNKIQKLRFSLVALCGAIASLSAVCARTKSVPAIIITAVLIPLLLVVLGMYLRQRKAEPKE